MRKLPLRLVLSPLFVLLSSCATTVEKKLDLGPLVVGCVVDAKDGGYACSSIDQDSFFVRFEDASGLVCFAPKDLESYIKACKKRKLSEVSTCTVDKGGVPLCGKNLSDLDSLFCMSPTDYRRVTARCSTDGY